MRGWRTFSARKRGMALAAATLLAGLAAPSGASAALGPHGIYVFRVTSVQLTGETTNVVRSGDSRNGFRQDVTIRMVISLYPKDEWRRRARNFWQVNTRSTVSGFLVGPYSAIARTTGSATRAVDGYSSTASCNATQWEGLSQGGGYLGPPGGVRRRGSTWIMDYSPYSPFESLAPESAAWNYSDLCQSWGLGGDQRGMKVRISNATVRSATKITIPFSYVYRDVAPVPTDIITRTWRGFIILRKSAYCPPRGPYKPCTPRFP